MRQKTSKRAASSRRNGVQKKAASTAPTAKKRNEKFVQKVTARNPRVKVCYCNTIDWFVDMLGTIDFLASVIDGNVYVDTRAVNGKPDGLYFLRGHWKAVKGGVVFDSYKARYQLDGTAHFCQTYAAMMYLGEPLVVGDYAGNIVRAMQFWLAILKNNKALRDWFVQQIKCSDWAQQNKTINADDLLAVPDTPLSAITYAKLQLFIQRVSGAAAHLTGCKEG